MRRRAFSIWEKSNDKDEIAKGNKMLTSEGLDKQELGISTTLMRDLGRNQNIVLESSCLVAEVQHFECIFMDVVFSFLFLHVWSCPFNQINLLVYNKW